MRTETRKLWATSAVSLGVGMVTALLPSGSDALHWIGAGIGILLLLAGGGILLFDRLEHWFPKTLGRKISLSAACQYIAIESRWAHQLVFIQPEGLLSSVIADRMTHLNGKIRSSFAAGEIEAVGRYAPIDEAPRASVRPIPADMWDIARLPIEGLLTEQADWICVPGAKFTEVMLHERALHRAFPRARRHTKSAFVETVRELEPERVALDLMIDEVFG